MNKQTSDATAAFDGFSWLWFGERKNGMAISTRGASSCTSSATPSRQGMGMRYAKTWVDAGLPPPETGVSVELKHVRAGRVARK